MSNAHEIINLDFVNAMFSDCLGLGAVTAEKEGSTYVLQFPEPDPFYFGFSILDNDDIRCFSDLPGFEEVMPAQDFIDSIDVLNSALLERRDGIDRGLTNVDA